MGFLFTGLALQAGTELGNVGLWFFYPGFLCLSLAVYSI